MSDLLLKDVKILDYNRPHINDNGMFWTGFLYDGPDRQFQYHAVHRFPPQLRPTINGYDNYVELFELLQGMSALNIRLSSIMCGMNVHVVLQHHSEDKPLTLTEIYINAKRLRERLTESHYVHI